MRLAFIALLFLVLIGMVAFTIWRLNASTTRELIEKEKKLLLRLVETDLASDIEVQIERVRPWLRIITGDRNLRAALDSATPSAARLDAQARFDSTLASLVRPGNSEDPSDESESQTSQLTLAGAKVLGVLVVDANQQVVARVRPDGSGVLDAAGESGWLLQRDTAPDGSDRRLSGDWLTISGPLPRHALRPSPAFPQALPGPNQPSGAAFRFGSPVLDSSAQQLLGWVFIDWPTEALLRGLGKRMGDQAWTSSATTALPDDEAGVGPRDETNDGLRIYLLDRAGRALYHPDRKRRLGIADNPEDTRVSAREVPRAALELMQRGRSASLETAQLLVALAPIVEKGPASDWFVVSTLSQQVVTRRIREHEQRINLLGAGLVALVMAAAFFTGRLVVREVKSRTEASYLRRLLSEQETSERFLTSLFNAIGDPIVVQGPDYRIMRANLKAQELYGGNLVGRRCYQVYRGADEKTAACARNCPVDQVFATKKPFTTELRNPSTAEVNLISCFPLLGPDGEVLAVIEHCRDVTERKRLEEHLVHTEKLSTIGEMAAGVAHEINNPVGVISMFAQLLAEELEENEGTSSEALEKVRTIEKNAQQVGRIAKSLLDFSRKSSGDAQDVDLGATVKRAQGVVCHQNAFDNVRIRCVIPDDLPRVRGDEGQLTQVLVNLLLNAAQAMAEGGEILVTGSRGDPARDDTGAADRCFVGNLDASACPYGTVRLAVRDSGHGIPKRDLRKIFDPFFTTKPQGQGTGLGLAVSYGIVTNHAGRMEIESKVNSGTCFTLELPALEPPAQTATQRDEGPYGPEKE